MSLAWPIALLAACLPLFFVAYKRLRPKARKPQFVAEASALATLPSYLARTRRARRWRLAERSILIVIASCFLLLMARPQVLLKSHDQEKSRDIVLCLDTSGSMKPYIEESLNALREVYKQNPSDRYGIVVFASRPVTVLPLTRDSVAIEQKIDLLTEVYVKDNDKNYQFKSLVGYGSDVGSGVEEAVKRFDNLETQKSRNLILVSDLDHFDDNSDRDAYLAKINLLPQNRINTFIMQTPLEFEFASAPPQIIAVSGAQVYQIEKNNTQQSAQQISDQIFNQALNTTTVVSRNYGDYPYAVFAVLIGCCGIWSVVVAKRWRRT